jgi:DNA-binding transcriptional LysR family regulator
MLLQEAMFMMNLSALIYFFSIAQGSTFLGAAEENNISQSSLSKSIQHLEVDLGVKLFDRSSRSAKLTPAGIALYDDLVKIAPLYSQLRKHMQTFSQTFAISCCAIPTFSIFKINNLINGFVELNPKIMIDLHTETDIPTAMNKLLCNDYDFLIMRQPVGNYGEVDFTFVADDHMLAVLPKNHILASKDTVSVSELKETASRIMLDACMSSVMTDLMPIIGWIPHSAPKVLLRRQDLLATVSSGSSISLYFSGDISVFKLDNVVAVSINDVPYQPVVIASSKKTALSKEHISFKKYLVESLSNAESAVGV